MVKKATSTPGSPSQLEDGGSLSPDFVCGEFMRSLMDSIPEALIVADVEGRILAVNRTACAMFGYLEGELIRRNVSMLMPSPERERHVGYMTAYLETGQRRIIGIGRYVMAMGKGGRPFPADLTVGQAELSGTRCYFGFLRDLSQEEERYRELGDLREEIAQTYRVSAMSLLASAIAHEINQPLAAIRNYVETIGELARHDTPIGFDQLSEAMEACSKETERAGEIIRRLRQFMTKGDAELERHSLRKLVGDGLSLALPDGVRAEVDVTVHLAESADKVLADGVQIEQVLVNLLRNAMRAVKGSAQPRLLVTSLEHPAMVEVIVEDSGPGVKVDKQEQLFLPFKSTNPGNLGVGLAICHAIIHGHGGQIWASQSELGGAAFHFTIPRIIESRE